MMLVNMPRSCFVYFICLCTLATASILQGLSQTFVSLKDSYYHIKPSNLLEINVNQSNNASNSVLLQNKSHLHISDGLHANLRERLLNNTNATHLTQMFHIGAAKRGKRNVLDLITPKTKRHKKLIKGNYKFPGISKLDTNRKNSRSRRRK